MTGQPDAISKQNGPRSSIPWSGWEEFARELVEFFASIKLAMFLFLFIAVTATIGTVIQQNERPESYIQEYGENTYRWFLRLGFTDVYHTWWFTSLLGLLCINSLTCFHKRFPGVWRSMAGSGQRVAGFREGYEAAGRGVDREQERDRVAAVGTILY